MLQLTVVGMLRGMSEVGGPGDRAQELKAQVTQRPGRCVPRRSRGPLADRCGGAKGPAVVQDKPGAAVGTALAVLGLLILRRRQRRREKAQQVRGRLGQVGFSGGRGASRVGSLIRRRRRWREEDS